VIDSFWRNTQAASVDDFLNQIEVAAGVAEIYYLALSGALVVPDMCGALTDPAGRATPDGYKGWFDANIAPVHVNHWTGEFLLTGEDCYRFRCSFLHQGRTQHPASSYDRIYFVEPGSNPGLTAHMNLSTNTDESALNIDVRQFCLEMVTGARGWLATVRGTEPYETNLNSFVRRHAGGLPPHMVGVPVIS
jgi:hypothetical protein